MPDQKGYKFSYDALNRLKNADYIKLGTDWNVNSAFNEGGLNYDLNGNIMTLNRKGDNVAIDALGYHYTGNQLNFVDDTSDALKGFINGNTSGFDYGYDPNGNMEIDRNKGITGITYNFLICHQL